jgi:hypothetical protein
MRVLVEARADQLELGLVAGHRARWTGAGALGHRQHRETPMRADAWLGLGRALAAQQRFDEAAQPARAGRRLRRSFDAGNAAGIDAAEWLAGWIAGWAIDARQRLRPRASRTSGASPRRVRFPC